jgi:hypothetical protein
MNVVSLATLPVSAVHVVVVVVAEEDGAAEVLLLDTAGAPAMDEGVTVLVEEGHQGARVCHLLDVVLADHLPQLRTVGVKWFRIKGVTVLVQHAHPDAVLHLPMYVVTAGHHTVGVRRCHMPTETV